MMSKKNSITFINRFKIDLNKKNTKSLIWISTFFFLISVAFLLTAKEYIGVSFSILFIVADSTLSILLRKKSSFINDFLFVAMKFFIMAIYVNLCIYGFQQLLQTFNIWFYLATIVFQIIVLILIVLFTFRSIEKGKVDQYYPIPIYVSFTGFSGYFFAKYFLSDFSNEIVSIVVTVSFLILVVIFLYACTGLYLPKWYLAKKYKIEGYETKN